VIAQGDHQLALLAFGRDLDRALVFTRVAVLDDVGAGFVYGELATANGHIVQAGRPAGLVDESGDLLQAIGDRSAQEW
jgi:hypothetical protein